MATEKTMTSADEWNTAALMIPHEDTYDLHGGDKLCIRLRKGVWILPQDELGGPVKILYVGSGERVVFNGADPIAALAAAYQYYLDKQKG